MIKKTLLLILAIFALIIFPANAGESGPILFYGEGCPHCAQVEKYLQDNEPPVKIEQKEIYRHPENAEEFNKICEEHNIGLMNRGVPFLYAEDKCYIGRSQIIEYLENIDEVSIASVEEPEEKKEADSSLTLPFLIGAAVVDAVNPCAFAVLLILMTTVLAAGDRRRALFSGLAFTVSIFISYLLMGLGLYSVVATFEMSNIFMKIVGALALIIGLFNLKDFFWYGKGFLMEVPLAWRPKLKSLIRSVTGPLGAFIIGFAVSLFLLPCTSGPYIVIIGMLGHQATYNKAVWYLVLYNLIFVLPMLLISFGAYWGMNVAEAEEKRQKNLRILHLLAGLIMTIMGVVLLFGWI